MTLTLCKGDKEFDGTVLIDHWSSSQAFPSTANANITVSVATSGSDTPTSNRPYYLTGGDYSAYPFLTVQAALDALPRSLSSYLALVSIGSGTFDGYQVAGFSSSKASSGFPNSFPNALTIAGTYTASTVTTGPQTGTAGAGTTTTVVQQPTAAANWTVNNLKDKFFRITSGGGAPTTTIYQIAPIISNTATSLTLSTALTGLNSTSVFDIVDIGTIINDTLVQTGDCITVDIHNAIIQIVGQKIVPVSATSGILVTTSSGQTNIRACQFSTSSGNMVNISRTLSTNIFNCLFTGGAAASESASNDIIFSGNYCHGARGQSFADSIGVTINNNYFDSVINGTSGNPVMLLATTGTMTIASNVFVDCTNSGPAIRSSESTFVTMTSNTSGGGNTFPYVVDFLHTGDLRFPTSNTVTGATADIRLNIGLATTSTQNINASDLVGVPIVTFGPLTVQN